jgi:hypothetical protein
MSVDDEIGSRVEVAGPVYLSKEAVLEHNRQLGNTRTGDQIKHTFSISNNPLSAIGGMSIGCGKLGRVIGRFVNDTQSVRPGIGRVFNKANNSRDSLVGLLQISFIVEPPVVASCFADIETQR